VETYSFPLCILLLNFNASLTPRSIKTSSEPPKGRLARHLGPTVGRFFRTWNDQTHDSSSDCFDTGTLPSFSEAQAGVLSASYSLCSDGRTYPPISLTLSSATYLATIPPSTFNRAVTPPKSRDPVPNIHISMEFLFHVRSVPRDV
jgi:hypothetical protein